jgi:DNA-binding response OmpR family regulator
MNLHEKILIFHNKLDDYKEMFHILEEHFLIPFYSTDRETFLQLFTSEEPDLVILDLANSESLQIIPLARKILLFSYLIQKKV